MKKIQITKEGLEELKKELEELKNVKRPELVERLSDARTQGDLTENSDYHSAKNDLEFLDGRISEIEYVFRNAQVVASSSKNAVSVGTKVTLRTGRKEHVFYIVGEWEADTAGKKISHTSPLGKALIGKKIGEKVEVEAPAGKIIYEIVSIG